MEEKLKKECKAYVEKIFKKYEQFTSGSILKGDVKHLLKQVIPEYEIEEHEEELNELLANYAKASKYQAMNKETKKLEMKYLENTLDFPSVLAIVVHFLKKFTMKEQDFFSGQSNVKPKDFPAKEENNSKKNDMKKKLF